MALAAEVTKVITVAETGTNLDNKYFFNHGPHAGKLKKIKEMQEG